MGLFVIVVFLQCVFIYLFIFSSYLPLIFIIAEMYGDAVVWGGGVVGLFLFAFIFFIFLN